MSKQAITIFLSDVHMGFPTSLTGLLLQALKTLQQRYKIKEIVVVGDFSDDYIFRFICMLWNRSANNALLQWLFNQTAVEGTPIKWIRGNHDTHLPSLLRKWKFPRPIVRRIAWKSNSNRCCAIHGDRFDTSLVPGLRYIATELVSMVYLAFQLCSRHYNPGKGPQFFQDRWLEAVSATRERVLEYAKKNNYRLVVYGHTHLAEITEQDGVILINTGCWTLAPAHLVIAKGDSYKLLEVTPQQQIRVVQSISL